MNETLFYVFGIALAVSAVVFSFLGLKSQGFPGKAFPIVMVWFLVLAGGATTFAVLHAKDEQEHKAKEFEQAGEEIEQEEEGQFEEIGPGEGPEEEEAGDESPGPTGPENGAGTKEKEESSNGKEGEPQASGEGAGGTVEVTADESALLYTTKSIESAPGEVTVDFDNPSSIPHNVAIEDEAGEQLLETEIIAQGKDSAEADLAAGTYTFYCTVPGHREAGMEGTLTVK